MARVWWDAMDWTTTTQMGGSYSDAGFSSYGAAGRFGGRACGVLGSSGTGLRQLASQDRYSAGIAVNTGPSLIQAGLLLFAEGTATKAAMTLHARLDITSTGRVRLLHGATSAVLVQTADAVIVPDAWHYICCGLIIHDTTGEAFISVDGAAAVTASGLDTRNGGTGNITQIGVGGTGGGDQCTVDDFYIEDTYDTALPERRVETLYPNADGATLNLTPSTGVNHYAVVDEASVSTADYLSGSTAGDIDLLGLTTLSYTPDAIDGVLARVVMAKTDAASREASIGIKSGATTDDGPTVTLSATPLHYSGDRHIVDPNTAAAWTKAAIDALQLQPKVVS